jgi:hypothetical protein
LLLKMTDWRRQGSFSYDRCRVEKGVPKKEGKSNRSWMMVKGSPYC